MIKKKVAEIIVDMRFNLNKQDMRKFNKFKDNMHKYRTNANKTIKKNKELQLSFRSLFSGKFSMGSSLLGLGVGAAAGGSIAFVNQAKKIENVKASLLMVTDSAAGAEEKFHMLTQLSKSFGLNLQVAAEGFTKFAIAGKGKSSMAEIESFFQSFSKYSRAVGQSTFRYEKSMGALTQMFDKGQVYAEELRQQLAENLPNAIAIFAKASGYEKPGDLLEAVKDGAVRLEDILPELTKEFDSAADSGGAFLQQTTGLETAINRFKTALLELVDETNKKGLGDFFGDIIKSAGDTVPSAGPWVSYFKAIGKPISEALTDLRAFIAEKHDFDKALKLRQESAGKITKSDYYGSAGDALVDLVKALTSPARSIGNFYKTGQNPLKFAGEQWSTFGSSYMRYRRNRSSYLTGEQNLQSDLAGTTQLGPQTEQESLRNARLPLPEKIRLLIEPTKDFNVTAQEAQLEMFREM